MNRLFIIGILIMSLLTGVVLFSASSIATLGEDGLAMPESSGVTQSLRSGEEHAVGLVPVEYEDTVYSSLTGYYVGKERIAIDRVYPIYINGGAGLRFLDEETWLFSADVDLLQTYEGMYLNDGTTYNSDMTRADLEEFILLVLSNGLHMNAQHAVFTNRLGSTDIPANSILYFSKEALRWYSLENESLLYGEETALFDASITIGDHTYDYYAFLEALGVIQEAIDNIRDGEDPEEDLNEIIDILDGEEEENPERQPHSGATGTVEEDLPAADTGAAAAGDSGDTSSVKEKDNDLKEGDGSDKSHADGENTAADGSSGSTGAAGSNTGSGNGDDSLGDGSQGDGSGAGGGSGSGATEGDSSEDAGQNPPGGGGELGGGGATNPDAGSGDSGNEDAPSGPPAYQDPKVELTDLEAWSYALHGKLTITDPANTVIKGARIAIYKEVEGHGATEENEQGQTIYPAESYTGKSALLRKTYAGTQEFALATLPPNTDIYVQYTYRYNGRVEVEKLDEEGNPVRNEQGEIVMEEVVRRLSVTSDLVKLTTPDNDEIAPVAASWKECFAMLDKDIRLEELKLRNTADYDAEKENFDYENFKKNTLAYVNRLEFTLTPAEGGEAVVLSTGSSVLRGAKEEFGTTFTSSGGRLEPSTQYTYTVRALDRYGNSMPLTVDNGSGGKDADDFIGILYTRKSAPTVQIEEISNVTDKLTLKVTVTDASDALLKDAEGNPLPLQLTVEDGEGTEADIYGSWEEGAKKGQTFGSVSDYESKITVLELEAPSDGSTYTFTLDSLAFAKAYTIRVKGSYDPQPEQLKDVETPRLPVEEHALLGSHRAYTASLSTGNIQFSSVVPVISDTYATLGFTMNQNTTTEILSIVDAFRLTVTDSQGKEVLTTTLTMEDLDTMDYRYDSKTGSVVLQEANGADHTPGIELVGEESQFTGRTLWEALLLELMVDGNGEGVYSNPAQLRIAMTEGTLNTSTTYQLTMESLVYKSSIEYQVPTTLTTAQFRTKKIQPKLMYEDFFVGGDVAQFLDLRIYDQDETIQQGGLVYVDLYYGETLLSTQPIYATSESDGETMDLVFENIISDAEYTIVFRAAAFNDGGGFSANKQLWIFDDFLGGSGLSGDLTLEGLEYTSTRSAGTTLVRYNGAEVEAKIDSGEWAHEADYPRIITEKIDLPAAATFVRIDNLGYHKNSTTIYFYDDGGKEVSWRSGEDRPYRHTSGGMLTGVPEGAVTMQLRLSSEEYHRENGLHVSYYTTPQANLVTEADALIPVQPGDLLCFNSTANNVKLYNESEKYLGGVGFPQSTVFVVPDRTYYISVANADFGVYKVASAEAEQGYTAEVSAIVEDNEGYLSKLTDTPTATLSVYKSDNIVDPVYDSTPIFTQVMPLTEGEDGRWTGELEELLEKLDPACGYKMVLTAEYRGSTVELDTVTFRTDGVYFTISNEDELQAVNRNPYANYIVVEDFTVTRSMGLNLWGTIDFQGHVITNEYLTNSLFSYIYAGGEVRNLVVEYPENAEINASLIFENRGTVENLIVRTNGTHTSLTYQALVCSVNRDILRNFVVRLGGDLYLSAGLNSNVALLCANNNYGATLENGYIYGANGAGVVFERGQGGYTGGILQGGVNSLGSIRNIFTRMDIWFPTEVNGTDNYKNSLFRQATGTVDSIYHVGDYYLLGSEGQKNISYRLEQERFFAADNTRPFEELWHVTQYNYADNQAVNVSQAAPATLYDAAWQQQVLGDGFDVENCVPMGFYPRLQMSDCMQKHQEYLPLPALAGDVPKLVGDGMAEGFVQGNEAGAILLRFQNDRALPIRSVTIDGLQVNQIHSQERAEDGLWNVVVDVTALEYRSAYTVESFTYLNGTAVQSVPKADYTTTGVEFWKEVDSLTDWMAINDHMDWNYRLTADLDFAADTLTPGAVMLNGSKTDMSKAVAFSGKLDGSYYDENGELQLHTIRNLTLAETKYPYVIYQMKQGSALTNLVVEDMTLTASSGTSSTYSGFVRYALNARMENLHFRGLNFRGVAQMGALAGRTDYSFVQECSVADSMITDAGTGTAVYAGGLVGYLNYCVFTSCYVRDLQMAIQNSAAVSGVGGITGYTYFDDLQSCYATGIIRATANQVGGIYGAFSGNSRSVKCWSNMDLFVTGDYVGAIGGGYGDYASMFLLGVGDISATGENVDRLFGESGFADSAHRTGYAFSEQTVSGLEEGETGDVKGLLTSKQLGQRATWTDLIQMGSGFEYDSLHGGYFPKVLNTEGEIVWGQTDIPIPGLGSDHYITIQEAVYDSTNGKYRVNGQWVHPGYTTDYFTDALKKGLVTEELSVALDGLGLTTDSIAVSAAGEGKSHFSITSGELLRALDIYALTVKYDSINLQVDIDFGQPLYHEVPDLATWDELMRAGHGTTGENFRIIGTINFDGKDATYRNLKLGRLEGMQTGSKTPGFYNLEYLGGYAGEPWIESVSGGIKNLTFQDITADFTAVLSVAKRAGTGLILSVTEVSDCTFENIHIGCNGYSSNKIGFFSIVNGDLSNIDMKDMSLKVDSKNAASSNYGGALAGYIHAGISNLTAENVTVSLPKTSYMGGIVGYVNRTITSPCSNLTLKNINVEGYSGVGSLASRIFQQITNLTLDGFTVKAQRNAGGVAEYAVGIMTDLTVKNGSVTITSTANAANSGTWGYYAGGVFGWVREWTDVTDVLVQNVTVTGNHYSGGFLGTGDVRKAKNIRILDCTVISNGDFSKDKTAAGGVFGYRSYATANINTYCFEEVTVRNTTVQAVYNAGGIGGLATTAAVNRCYIAEDVTVTATGSANLSSGSRVDGSAGGVFGTIQYPQIRRVACGAEVTGARNVGGLIGTLNWDTAQNAEIIKSYYVGTVTATQDNAAGVIGYVDTGSNSVNLTKDHVDGVLLAGTITTPGSKASLLANQKTGLTPDGKIGVWDNTVLGGHTLKALMEAENQLGSAKTTLPESGTLYTAAQFGEAETYKAMGITAADMCLDSTFTAGSYMPFVYNTNKKILSDTQTYQYPGETAAEEVGILKPLEGGNPDALAVYASGAHTVNIEVGTPGGGTYPGVTVQAGGQSLVCQPDENGVITLTYDFTTDLTVDGADYYAEDLKRTVMTYDGYWYYIDENGAVCYGTGEQESGPPTVTGIGEAVHLWQGQVLCKGGSVYTLEGSTATLAQETFTGFTQLAEAKPFWSYDLGSIAAEVYHDFTLYAGEAVEYRIFEMGDKLYSVSPYQGMVYDGVMLSVYDDGVNDVERYFAMLGQDGSIVNYLTVWEAQNFNNSAIDHISNNLGFDKQILLARYEDGSVVGYDYHKGELLFSTMPQITSFRLYAGNQLRNLFGSFFGGGNPLTTDESYASGEELLETSGELSEGAKVPGSAAEDGNGINGGAIGSLSGSITETAEGSIGGFADINGTGLGGTAAEAGNEMIAEGSGAPGGSIAAGEAGESGETGNAGETSEADGAEATEAEAGVSGAATDAAAEGNSGQIGESEGLASGTYYIPGKGVVVDGIVTLTEKEVNYTPGKGVYAKGKLIYGESLARDSELSEELKKQQAVELVTSEERKQQVLAAMPAMTVAYDPTAGTYTAMNGTELLAGTRRVLADVTAENAEDLLPDDLGAQGDSKLEIGRGFGRTLTDSEQSGFVLLGVLTAAAGVILVLVYIRISRRRGK